MVSFRIHLAVWGCPAGRRARQRVTGVSAKHVWSGCEAGAMGSYCVGEDSI